MFPFTKPSSYWGTPWPWKPPCVQKPRGWPSIDPQRATGRRTARDLPEPRRGHQQRQKLCGFIGELPQNDMQHDTVWLQMYIYIHIYLSIYLSIYIYILRIAICWLLYVHVCVCVYIYKYIYVYKLYNVKPGLINHSLLTRGVLPQ